jgi:hypothetical protein
VTDDRITSALRLFPSEQDEAEDRRRARIERALAQSRCGCCGRFARREGLVFTAVCEHCMNDKRSVIVHKVAQARRWWLATKTA